MLWGDQSAEIIRLQAGLEWVGVVLWLDPHFFSLPIVLVTDCPSDAIVLVTLIVTALFLDCYCTSDLLSRWLHCPCDGYCPCDSIVLTLLQVQASVCAYGMACHFTPNLPSALDFSLLRAAPPGPQPLHYCLFQIHFYIEVEEPTGKYWSLFTFYCQ